VPVVVDGKRTMVAGGLWSAPRPSLRWFWPLVLLLACVPALLRLDDAGYARAGASVLAALALTASTVARLGRGLYGRPSLSTGQLVLVGLTCVVAVGLGLLWRREEWRTVAGLLIGVAAAYQGLALLATLRNTFVLSVLPAWLERAATSLSLAAGAALMLVTMTAAVADRASADEADEESRREALLSR
jgi:hypothetical protein